MATRAGVTHSKNRRQLAPNANRSWHSETVVSITDQSYSPTQCTRSAFAGIRVAERNAKVCTNDRDEPFPAVLRANNTETPARTIDTDPQVAASVVHAPMSRKSLSKLTRKIGELRANGTSDVRFRLLRRIAKMLVPEYRLRWNSFDWWKDKDFNAYLTRFDEINGLNTDRRWTVHQLLRFISDVGGDTAECGVFEGATSFLICKANEQNTHFPRKHFLFDSFAGLSKPQTADGPYWRQGDLATSEDVARERLRGLDNVVFMKGWIPSRFSEVADRHFAFVHIDVDLYQPTLDALEFFFPRLTQGAILVVDDFGFTTCPGATRAVREALNGAVARGFVALPDGGGFLIKGKTAAPPAKLLVG